MEKKNNADENGQYLGKCFQCGNSFIGHKHRMICKLCDASNKAKWDAMTEDERQIARVKMAEAATIIFGSSNPTVDHRQTGKGENE